MDDKEIIELYKQGKSLAICYMLALQNGCRYPMARLVFLVNGHEAYVHI